MLILFIFGGGDFKYSNLGILNSFIKTKLLSKYSLPRQQDLLRPFFNMPNAAYIFSLRQILFLA